MNLSVQLCYVISPPSRTSHGGVYKPNSVSSKVTATENSRRGTDFGRPEVSSVRSENQLSRLLSAQVVVSATMVEAAAALAWRDAADSSNGPKRKEKQKRKLRSNRSDWSDREKLLPREKKGGVRE